MTNKLTLFFELHQDRHIRNHFLKAGHALRVGWYFTANLVKYCSSVKCFKFFFVLGSYGIHGHYAANKFRELGGNF